MSPRTTAAALIGITLITAIRPAADAEFQPVVWTNIVNATVTGTTLQKTAGWDGVDDAGATSQQELTSGDGYVQFTVGEATTFWLAGLSRGNNGTGYADIDFAFRFNGAGWADVLEKGIYQSGGDTPYAAGDVFKVAVVNGRVQYSRNGKLLRESASLPQYPMILDASLGSIGATVRDAILGVSPAPPPGGGFLETSGSPALRARFTKAQIDSFLPANGARGAFKFPSPYNTTGIRLTHAGDCAAGSDCLWYAGYSYWRNINNHVGSADMYIFLGTDRNRGGVGPILLRYNKATDHVQPLGALFPGTSAYSSSTGEGWYFSARRPTALYTFLPGRRELRRYDVVTRQFDSTAALDLANCPRQVCPSTAAYITQPHSSDDDLVHSATVQSADWGRIGCVVYQSSARRFRYYGTAAGFVFDECHVDKSGRWVLLHESRTDGSRRNRVIDITNGRTATVDDVNGALGHLDMGFGYAVGADTFNPLPNATILLKFPLTRTQRPIGPVVHFNKRWDIAAANHLAHGNARNGIAAESQYACGSNASRVADMADEIVCFPLNASQNADGSLTALVVAQVLTNLDASGGNDADGDDYEQTPKGNLDVTGRYFLWTTNLGGNRLDALLVKIPAERLEAQTGSPE